MKEVVFLIPTKLTRAYFLTLYQHCEQQIYRHFQNTFRPIARGVPRETKEFDASEVLRVLEREFQQSSAIGYLVVAPTSSRQLAQGVAKIAQRETVPVIALSLPFPNRDDFVALGIPVPPAVVSNSEEATQALGRAAAAELRRRNRKISHARIVLVYGERRRIDSNTRIKNFDAGICRAGIRTITRFTKHCDWRREDACSEIKRLLAESNEPIDVIFAANDEMALGAREAIREAARDGDVRVKDCIIYGFDAIDEVRRLITENDDQFKGSVEQNLEEMALSLVELLARSESGVTLDEYHSIQVQAKCVLAPTTIASNTESNQHRSPTEGHPGITKPGPEAVQLGEKEEVAYSTYKVAEKRIRELCPQESTVTDYQAYQYLKNHPQTGYDPPPFNTWTRYLRTARRYYHDAKNSPRTGRTGRSIDDSSGHPDDAID